MRAFDPEVMDIVWEAVEALIPVPRDDHPLGCHRPRASDRACFEVILTRTATGCSFEDAERLCGNVVSDTTVRPRRNEWVAAGVFDKLVAESINSYDRIIGLELDDVSRWTGRCRKPLVAGRERAPTRPIEPSSDGSGRSSLTRPASLSDGAPLARTATTRFCSSPPSITPPRAVCSSMSTPCGWAGAMTPRPPESASLRGASPMRSSPRNANEAQHRPR